MKCPHCTNGIHESWRDAGIGYERPGGRGDGADWHVGSMICPECDHIIIRLMRAPRGVGYYDVRRIVWPFGATRPLPQEVDERYARDFAEAVAVLAASPKASAALSRRMLQDVLREKASVKHSNLFDEIQEVIDSGALPAAVADNLDAVRAVGNFAAHPIKSTNTGEVVEVEPGEAEWLLEVLESLFDVYFVVPARAKERRKALNAKLADAGKPELKTGSA